MDGAIREITDWNRFARIASEHGIRPLCLNRLRGTDPSIVPLDFIESLTREVRMFTRRSLALTAELFFALDVLERAGIPAISYKGPALAAQAFGDVGLREYGDLDILVRHNDIARAAEFLQRQGYSAALPLNARDPYNTPIPGQYSFSRPGGPPVELHTEKTLRYYPVPLDFKLLDHRVVPIRIGDRTVKTFTPEAALTILSLHGCKHIWSRLLWVSDIAWLLHSNPSLDWRDALDLARRLGAHRMMLTGVGLSAELLGASIPEDIETRISGDRFVCYLIEKSREELLASGAASGVMQRAMYRIRSVEGLAAGLRYLARLTGSPAEDDWAEGKRARFSAALWRPLRLIRKYGITRKRT